MLREHNVVVKNLKDVDLRFASCYPNLYRSAMSSLGFHIIYDFLNSREDIYCERVVYPYGKSLETGTNLRDFDVVSFSLQYEQDYFNVLEMMRKGGIPPHKEDRTSRDPLIIAGGPCASSNPLPMSRFFDLFIVGEAEVILDDVLDLCMELDNPRDELDAFMDIEGVYLPDNPVKIRIVKDMKDAWQPLRQVVPETDDKQFIPAFGRSFLLEVSRGCVRGCRFCMAGCIYRPRREVPLKKLLETAEKGRQATGLNKIALIGAAVSDHSQVEDLCRGLDERGFQVTTPSLRIESISEELLEILGRSGLKTVTIAPESIWKVRKSVNKPIPDEKIFKTIQTVFKQKMNVKLYFMLGLPQETMEDVESLSMLIKDFVKMADRRDSVRVSANPFIPKPHTPFQWHRFDFEDVKSKIRYLTSHVNLRSFKIGSPKNALVQYALSTGDAGLGDLIEEKVSTARWKKVVEARDPEDLPWKNIDVGVKDDFLKKEYEKALNGDVTPWCETFGCYNCGACK